ncbi:D-Ala-D-Ala carboxypeptidase 3 (S13) family protein [compost metagenome]
MSLRKEFGDYAKELTRKVFTFKSMPMFRILKEMNRYSHNYIANMVFDRLGGAARYETFMKNRLSMDTSAVHLLNGSGYPVDGDYNLANCGAITYMLRDLDNVITHSNYSKKYQMADLFPVGGMSEPYSTFKSFYSGGTFDKTMVAKTGSAQQAITFAGALSTKDGNLYFAALTSPVSYGNPFLNQSRFLIKDLMQIMAERERLKPMDYTVPGLLPAFDAGIVLKELQVAAAPPITSPAAPAVIPTPEAPAAPAATPLDEDDETPKPGALLLIKKG